MGISLDSGDSSGINADWWLVVKYQSNWYYYARANEWAQGFKVAYQGGLSTFSNFESLNASDLPTGTFIFYFAVDLTMDGALQTGEGQFFYDSVVVNITSSSSG